MVPVLLQSSEETVTESHRCVHISLYLCVRILTEVWRASWSQTVPIAAPGGRLRLIFTGLVGYKAYYGVDGYKYKTLHMLFILSLICDMYFYICYALFSLRSLFSFPFRALPSSVYLRLSSGMMAC
jgi:hypothetical protein